MPEIRRPFHPYPQANPEPEIYIPSFFLDVQFDNQLVHAEIRPLSRDKGYLTVNLNHVFLAHIHKVGDQWYDFLGSKLEIYQAVGREIDEYKRKIAF